MIEEVKFNSGDLNMQMTEVLVLNFHDNVSAGVSFAGPVRFICDGDPNTLMVSHSIWEPRKLFKNLIPFGGKIVIESVPSYRPAFNR